MTDNDIQVFIVGLFHRNTPDPAQESQGDGYSKPMIQALSAVCVRSPHYGTRSVSSTHAKTSTSPLVSTWSDWQGCARPKDHRELLVHRNLRCNQSSAEKKRKGIVSTVQGLSYSQNVRGSAFATAIKVSFSKALSATATSFLMRVFTKYLKWKNVTWS